MRGRCVVSDARRILVQTQITVARQQPQRGTFLNRGPRANAGGQATVDRRRYRAEPSKGLSPRHVTAATIRITHRFAQGGPDRHAGPAWERAEARRSNTARLSS